MPRFYLHYEEKHAPPPLKWTVWRVILWVALFASLGLWMARAVAA